MNESPAKLTLTSTNPQNLGELTDYQSESIVSRTLIQDACGTLTVFSLDRGQALSAYTVPFNTFIQVLDGQAEITVGAKTCRVNTGEIVLMPGGMPHEVRANQRCKMLLTMFKTKN